MRGTPTGATIDELETLYRSRLSHFLRVAAAITGDRDRAHDAVQEAFGRAIRRRATYDGRGALEAWAWRFVVNAARDERRRGCDLASFPVHDHAQTNGHGGDDGAVATAIALLPERQRLVLFLRYYADLDYAAIAEALNIAAGTVAATLNAAHAALRRTLQEVPS
jgi:DNA-directed RNA polymerase specialized sigma24 family protein